jgi:hypothetical protein
MDTPELTENGEEVTTLTTKYNSRKIVTAGLPTNLHANPHWGQSLLNSQTSDSLQGYSGGRQVVDYRE